MSNLEHLRIYDNGGKTFDRYTVVFMDRPERAWATYECLGMSEHPFHPQGFGMHSSAMCGRHLGKRIKFCELPVDCQRCVMQDLVEWVDCEICGGQHPEGYTGDCRNNAARK